jgi:two-component system sensor histidine kinase MtrB
VGVEAKRETAPSLRASLTISLVALAVLALCAGTSLVLLSVLLHRTAMNLETALDDVRVASGMEAALLEYNRALDQNTRGALASDLRRGLPVIAGTAVDPVERRVLRQTARSLNAYLVSGDSRLFEPAFRSVRQLVGVNVEQSQTQLRNADRWDADARSLGVTVAIISVLGMAGVVFWLRASAFRPAFELSAVIERYANGEKNIRAREQGPVELSSIAHRFNEMAAELERQSRNRMIFLAGVAHDLRNPLSALRLNMIAPDRPLPAEDRIRQAFARISRQIERLDRMVWDFLDAARIEAGVLELRSDSHDLREVVQAVVELFEPSMQLHQILVDVPGTAVPVRCDLVRIEQVLGNIINNAIKYSPRGGRIDVSVRAKPGWAILSVTDQGMGMTRSELAQLFQPFERSTAVKGNIRGTGLGLYVARKIVEAHGGTIEVDSTPDQGSKFVICLPGPA